MAIGSFSSWVAVTMLYGVVLTFETVNEKLVCGNFIKATLQYFSV